MLVLPNQESEKTLLFITKFGNVRRNKVSDFINILKPMVKGHETRKQ